MSGRKRTNESGYALLTVLLAAAVVAIMLYKEIPRVAFQSQRHREQLLMERGEQFKRAIKMYRQVFPNQWPRDIAELESGHNRHFLRHNYVDPMTGKADWRFIHILGNVLTDSILNKKKQGVQGGSEGNSISVYSSIGESPMQTSVRPQDRRRASENLTGEITMGGAGARGGMGPGGEPEAQPVDPNQPLASGGIEPGQPGATDPAAAPGMTGGSPQVMVPNAPGQPGALGQAAYIAAPSTGAEATGVPNGQMPNAAVNLIGNLLTRPNPAGLAAVLGQNQLGAGGGQQGPVAAPGGGGGGGGGFSGSIGNSNVGSGGSQPTGGAQGIAGVASKAEREGIMVYNDRTAYNEWEFVFDPATEPRTGPTAGTRITPQPTSGNRSVPAPGAPPQPAVMQGGMGGPTGVTIRMGKR